MANINEQIQKAEEEIKQLQNRKRKLLNQKRDEERKARTHRLIERGAILESLLEQPERYENKQIKELLEVALQTSEAKAYLDKIGEGNGWTECRTVFYMHLKSPILIKINKG